MKAKVWLALAGLLISGQALSQGQAGVQGSASTGAQGSVAADRQGAQAATDASASGAASAQAGDRQASAALAGGSEIDATLTKPVDAKKAKPGDEVTATVTKDVKSGGRVVIPRGSRLVGRVTEAKPHGKGSADAAADASSRLGVVFDRAVLKDGRQVAVDATIQAIGAARTAASRGSSHANAGTYAGGRAGGGASSAGGGLAGGVAGAASGTLGATGSLAGSASGRLGSTVGSATSASAGAVGGLSAGGALTSGSRGVFGLKGLEIESATAGGAHGSVISSGMRNVRLESGTQMLLTSSARAGSGTAKSADQAGNDAASGSGGSAARPERERTDRR